MEGGTTSILFCKKVHTQFSLSRRSYSQETDELKWRSGPVTDRLSASLLVTKSGQLYHLMGHLNMEDAAKELPQLSSQVLRKFRRGFPSQWKALLWECKPPDK